MFDVNTFVHVELRHKVIESAWTMTEYDHLSQTEFLRTTKSFTHSIGCIVLDDDAFIIWNMKYDYEE